MLQPGDDIQASFRHLQSKYATKQLVELFDEAIPPLGIDFSHPFDVTEEKSLGDKSRQRGLINRGRMHVHCTADLCNRID